VLAVVDVARQRLGDVELACPGSGSSRTAWRMVSPACSPDPRTASWLY